MDVLGLDAEKAPPAIHTKRAANEGVRVASDLASGVSANLVIEAIRRVLE